MQKITIFEEKEKREREVQKLDRAIETVENALNCTQAAGYLPGKHTERIKLAPGTITTIYHCYCVTFKIKIKEIHNTEDGEIKPIYRWTIWYEVLASVPECSEPGEPYAGNVKITTPGGLKSMRERYHGLNDEKVEVELIYNGEALDL